MPNPMNLPGLFRPAYTFQKVAPTPINRRGSSIGPQTDIRYFQERAPLLKNMDKVVGTTTAPSPEHVFTGFTSDGYAKWEKKAAPAPAPAPAPAAPAAPAGPDYAAQIAELNQQSQEYRKQAEDIIAQGQAKVKELEDADLQRQKATELQQRLSIQAAAQSAANAARGGSAANLRIQPASQTAQMGGTQGFVRRANQFGMTRRSGSAGPVNPYEQVNV